MKITVISDTHSKLIPQQVINACKHVDLVIHTGDFCTYEDYEVFSKLAKVQAVHGNMDDARLCQLLPEKQIINLDGVNVGIVHGFGPAKKVLQLVQEKFKNDDVAAVFFGHSHQALNEKVNDVLYFNPGSPTDKIFAPFLSYGSVIIKNGRIHSEIIRIAT